jgi:hypothetical protein
MTLIDGISVTGMPWLKRGSMWYASVPINSLILRHYRLTLGSDRNIVRLGRALSCLMILTIVYEMLMPKETKSNRLEIR